MPYSTYLATAQLNWLAGTAFPSAPTNLYITIHDESATDDGSVGDITNSITGSSNRILLDPADLAAVTTATGGGYERLTTAILSIIATSVNVSMETATHFAVWDAITGGNLLMHDALDASIAINPGAQVRFSAGDLALRCI